MAREGTKPEVAIHKGGVSLDAYAPDGKARVVVRALGGGALSGLAAFTATPVTKIGEGLGPETLLGAGQTRLYGFHAARAGAIGLGVRADSDVVSATLLAQDGSRLGEGLVQMPDLAAGDYLLAVRAPSDATPVRIRPALAGVEPPGTGPPPEVIRTYVMREPEVQGMSATRLEESDEEISPAEEETETDGEDDSSEGGGEDEDGDGEGQGGPQ